MRDDRASTDAAPGRSPAKLRPALGLCCAMRLLVAEDDPRLRDVLVRGLETSGYFVDAVENGVEALEFLEAYDYAVVILDWRMPHMTGIHVVERIRAAADRTAVLMLT